MLLIFRRIKIHKSPVYFIIIDLLSYSTALNSNLQGAAAKRIVNWIWELKHFFHCVTLKVIARNESLLNSNLVNRRKSLYREVRSFLGSGTRKVSEIREIIQRDKPLSVILHSQWVSRFPSNILFFFTGSFLFYSYPPLQLATF